MKIMLFGSTGQIGSNLKKFLTMIGKVKVCTRNNCDFRNLDQIKKVIIEYSPNIIVNAAAYTDVERSEIEQATAGMINVQAVKTIANTAQFIKALLVMYSSDYVFDGRKDSPYVEDDKPNPLSFYGLTKFRGEEIIKNSGCNYLIFRTSWVYGNIYYGENFVNKIIKLAQYNSTLSIVHDQVGAPTSAEFIAYTTAQCLKKVLYYGFNTGIYHLTSDGYVSWYDFAKYILMYLQTKGTKFLLTPENIVPIDSQDYKSVITRPKNSVLDTNLIKKTFNVSISSWQEQINQILSIN